MCQIISRMRLKWYYFLKMSFHLIFEVFLAKNQKKNKVGKIRIYDEQKRYFEKKTLSSFLKASSTMLEGAKYPGGSWVSCSKYSSMKLPQVQLLTWRANFNLRLDTVFKVHTYMYTYTTVNLTKLAAFNLVSEKLTHFGLHN